MKHLSADLKRMLNTLALQDTAEYPPAARMQGALGSDDACPARPHDFPSPRRVALLGDGGVIDGVLQYAVECCKRQQATLDLVLYGKGRAQASRLRSQLERRGIAHELILLGEQSVDALAEYLCARRTLAYMLAPSDDPLARQLTEEVMPGRSGHLHLPMVLVDRSIQSRINRINAA